MPLRWCRFPFQLWVKALTAFNENKIVEEGVACPTRLSPLPRHDGMAGAIRSVERRLGLQTRLPHNRPLVSGASLWDAVDAALECTHLPTPSWCPEVWCQSTLFFSRKGPNLRAMLGSGIGVGNARQSRCQKVAVSCRNPACLDPTIAPPPPTMPKAALPLALVDGCLGFPSPWRGRRLCCGSAASALQRFVSWWPCARRSGR